MTEKRAPARKVSEPKVAPEPEVTVEEKDDEMAETLAGLIQATEEHLHAVEYLPEQIQARTLKEVRRQLRVSKALLAGPLA